MSFKKILYRHDLKKFENIIEKYNINLPRDSSISDVLLNNKLFNKIILTKIHPDKNCNSKQSNQDTQFAQQLKDKINDNIAIKKLLDETIIQANTIIYKSTIYPKYNSLSSHYDLNSFSFYVDISSPPRFWVLYLIKELFL